MGKISSSVSSKGFMPNMATILRPDWGRFRRCSTSKTRYFQ
jgi:hypothetical protein